MFHAKWEVRRQSRIDTFQQGIPQLNLTDLLYVFDIRALLIGTLADCLLEFQILIKLTRYMFHAHLEYLEFGFSRRIILVEVRVVGCLLSNGKRSRDFLSEIRKSHGAARRYYRRQRQSLQNSAQLVPNLRKVTSEPSHILTELIHVFPTLVQFLPDLRHKLLERTSISIDLSDPNASCKHTRLLPSIMQPRPIQSETIRSSCGFPVGAFSRKPRRKFRQSSDVPTATIACNTFHCPASFSGHKRKKFIPAVQGKF